jgi:nucleotide-binding universal stress UspA family protein
MRPGEPDLFARVTTSLAEQVTTVSSKQQKAGLLSTVIVPVAGPNDARETAKALRHRIGDEIGEVVVLHVIRKAGGAPDSASVEQMEEWAAESFDAFKSAGGEWCDRIGFEAGYQFGTDIADTILSEASARSGTVIAYTPRPGHALLRWLSGNTADELVEKAELPVLAVPEVES